MNIFKTDKELPGHAYSVRTFFTLWAAENTWFLEELEADSRKRNPEFMTASALKFSCIDVVAQIITAFFNRPASHIKPCLLHGGNRCSEPRIKPKEKLNMLGFVFYGEATGRAKNPFHMPEVFKVLATHRKSVTAFLTNKTGAFRDHYFSFDLSFQT